MAKQFVNESEISEFVNGTKQRHYQRNFLCVLLGAKTMEEGLDDINNCELKEKMKMSIKEEKEIEAA